ncbi:MAG: hypothetical protein MJA30_08015, partial [Cytophagales bacterium]|nr:hypothetical protein [Cytophagales bacterium]
NSFIKFCSFKAAQAVAHRLINSSSLSTYSPITRVVSSTTLEPSKIKNTPLLLLLLLLLLQLFILILWSLTSKAGLGTTRAYLSTSQKTRDAKARPINQLVNLRIHQNLSMIEVTKNVQRNANPRWMPLRDSVATSDNENHACSSKK